MVHDMHRQSASHHHLAAGAIWADSPRDLAREAGVIFSSLPEPSDVEALPEPSDVEAPGLIPAMRPSGRARLFRSIGVLQQFLRR